MEALRRRGDMPDLVAIVRGANRRKKGNRVNGSRVISALQGAAHKYSSGWVLNQKTVPEEIVGELGDLLAGHVRAGHTVYIDHARNITVTNLNNGK